VNAVMESAGLCRGYLGGGRVLGSVGLEIFELQFHLVEEATREPLLNHQRQALHPLPHIGVAHRDPYPRSWRNHRSAFRAAPTSVGDAEGKMLTLLPQARSMTIAGTCSAAAPS